MSTNQTESAGPDAVIDISIAHSPDSDDAFMFYGLATQQGSRPRLSVFATPFATSRR